MADGPLAGLLARAVVVIDKAGKVVYTCLLYTSRCVEETG